MENEMTAVSWFLAIGMVCYLGTMFYTLVLATFLDDDNPEATTTSPGSVDRSTDETLINYGRPTTAAIQH
jgi:hypothetical protein